MKPQEDSRRLASLRSSGALKGYRGALWALLLGNGAGSFLNPSLRIFDKGSSPVLPIWATLPSRYGAMPGQ